MDTEVITPKQKNLMEEWKPLLESENASPIADTYKRAQVAQLLENQKTANAESIGLMTEANPTNVQGNIARWDPVMIGMVRRAAPAFIAFDLAGVQSMNQPTGLIFSIKSYYNKVPAAANESLHKEVDTGFTGVTTDAVGDKENDPFAVLYTTGRGMTTAAMETDITQEMSFKIDKFTVEARGRQLAGSYSNELQQDLARQHGIRADTELSSILGTEMVTEINREFVKTLWIVAKLGAANTAVPGTYDLSVDSRGRWPVEEYKGLYMQLVKESVKIQQDVRRGQANKCLATPDVVSALWLAGKLDTGGPSSLGKEAGPTDFVFNPHVGRFAGQFDVYMDSYNVTSNAIAVGYRGSNSWDAGLYYAPYIPLELYNAMDPQSFTPRMAYKTRYALASNPFVESAPGVADAQNLTPGINGYWRKFKVTNL